MKNVFSFRLAEERDSAHMLDIYSRYVTETAVTFEYDVPTTEEFACRIRKVTSRYPWIVCECGGRVVGYAYASEFRERAAFKWSCELSVYVADDHQGHGIGKALYKALLDLLKRLGYRTAIACVTYPNEVSDKFHRSLGFVHTGVFGDVGYKLGEWRGVSWYQLPLAEYSLSPDAPKSIVEMDPAELCDVLDSYVSLIRLK